MTYRDAFPNYQERERVNSCCHLKIPSTGDGHSKLQKQRLMDQYAKRHIDSLHNTPYNSDEDDNDDNNACVLSETTTQKDGRIRALIKAEERDDEDFISEYVGGDDSEDGEVDEKEDDSGKGGVFNINHNENDSDEVVEPMSPSMRIDEEDVILALHGNAADQRINVLNPTRKSSIDKRMARRIAEGIISEGIGGSRPSAIQTGASTNEIIRNKSGTQTYDLLL